jgi:uncharacterized protein (TIGR00661 family)
MKILYAVQKTGNGHLARAQEIIPILQIYGDVDILTSGSQSQINLGFPVTHDFKGISLFYGSNGNVSFINTFFKNNYFKFIYQILQLNVYKYDLIINDYEPISAWACKLKGGNIISLSHQSSLFFKETPKPKKIKWLSWKIFKNYAPVTKKYGFHFDEYCENIFKPVIRKKIRNLKTSTSGNYVVYLPSYSDIKIIKELKRTSANWTIFSKHAKASYTAHNCTVFPIDENEFLNSFANCPGVLCNAGFELPSEALYLKKKLFVIPIKKQMEQECNAIALKEMGVLTSKKLDFNLIEMWTLSNKTIPVNYTNNIEKVIEEIVLENTSFDTEFLFI